MNPTVKKPRATKMFATKFPYRLHGSACTTQLPGVRPELDEVASTRLACKLSVQGRETSLTGADLHLAFLEILETVLGSELEAHELLQALQARIVEGEQARAAALPVIRRAQAPLREPWYGVEKFFEAGTDGKTANAMPAPVVVHNNSVSWLLAPDNFADFDASIAKKSELDQRVLPERIVVTGKLLSGQELVQIAKIAEQADCVAIVEVPVADRETLRETLPELYRDLPTSESWGRHVALVWNGVRVSDGRNDGGEPTYVPAAMIYAGMHAAQQHIAEPIAGYARPITVKTVDTSELELRDKLTDSSAIAEVNEVVIPVALHQGKLVFYGVGTGSTDKVRGQVQVSRVLSAIAKAMRQMLFQETFRSLSDKEKVRCLQERLDTFLANHRGAGIDRMLAWGRVKGIRPNPEHPTQTDVSLELGLKTCATGFNVKVHSVQETIPLGPES